MVAPPHRPNDGAAFPAEAGMHERADASRPDTGSSQNVLPVGTVLADSYRLTGLVAEPSPHAIVYRARSAAGEFVIKELFPHALLARALSGTAAIAHDPQASARMVDARRRFMLEAQLLEDAAHPGLPRVRGHFEANGTAYMVSEPVEGRTLEDHLIASGRLAIPEATTIIFGVLDALEVLHGHGILHRDIAPANVFLGKDGKPRLMGLATPRQLLMYGMPGAVAPRAGFAAIEMYGSRGKGPWTDVHAVSALLYFLLTGQLPASAVDRATGEALVPPARLVPTIPFALDALIVKGLAQRPEERPHSAERLRTMLTEALADTRTAGTPSFNAAFGSSFTPPGAQMPTPISSAGITPLSVSAYAPKPSTPVPFGFPAAHPMPLGDDDMDVADAQARSAIAFDSTGSVMVVPKSAAPMGRMVRIGGIALAAAIALFMVVRAVRGRDADEEFAAPLAQNAQPVDRNVVAPAVPEPMTSTSSGVEAVRQSGGTVVGRPSSPATSAQPNSGTESVDRPTARTERPTPPAEVTIEVPRIRAPVIATPLSTPTQSVAAETIEQLRVGLTNGRSRVEAGDYAGAQRQFRNTITRLDEIAATHLPSTRLSELRRDLEAGAQRAREACAAVNAMAARRNGRVVPCE
jgi:serine/threonine protein kinase